MKPQKKSKKQHPESVPSEQDTSVPLVDRSKQFRSPRDKMVRARDYQKKEPEQDR